MSESPYPIVENPDGTYCFTTEVGVKYTIVLFDASFHFDEFQIPNGTIAELSFGTSVPVPPDKKFLLPFCPFLLIFLEIRTMFSYMFVRVWTEGNWHAKKYLISGLRNMQPKT